MKKSLCGWSLVVVLLATLAGCLSPTDKWLTQNLTASEKSAIIASRGLVLYEKLLAEKDYTLVAQIRAYYATALVADAANSKTLEAIDALDAWLTKRQSDAKQTAATLTAKKPETLTEKDKIELVLVFRELKGLAPPDFDLLALEARVAPLEVEVLALFTKRIESDEKALAAAKTESAKTPLFVSLKNSVAALQKLDPKNPDVASAEARLAASLNAHLAISVGDTRKALGAKNFAEAVKALIVADKTLAAVSLDPPEDVQKLRYQIYFDWAKNLFDTKKYSEATSRINSALAVQSTDEALDLKVKIARAATTRDFDAEYAAIDKQIDGLIKSGDFNAAWSMVGTTLPQLKKEDTKAQATARRKQILEGVRSLYEKAVKSYNEEDYAEAKLGLDIVVAVDPGYLLAKSYHEKAKAKIQALGGR